METPITSEQQVKKVVPLNLTRLSQTEYVNQDHSITVPLDTTLEQLQHPDFWAHCAPHFTQFDKLRIVPDDGAWYAEYLVIATDRNSARVKLLNFTELDEDVTSGETPILPPTHAVKFRGRHHKYCAIRLSDGALLKTGMKLDEAHKWLADYLNIAKAAA